MTDETFSLAEKEAKEKLRQAVRSLNACYKQQNELTKQIAGLRAIIAAFARMRGEEFFEEEEFGMTDAIRMALAHNGLSMSPEEVKKAIYDFGFDTDSYENVMAAIGTALRRLVEQKEVTSGIGAADHKTRYQWAGGNLPLRTLLGGGGKKSVNLGNPPTRADLYKSGMRGDEKPEGMPPPPPKSK